MARKSILVVDDERSQREILEMILSSEGYDVTTAASGEAAIKFAKDRRFDLALTDLKMTGMDGIELLQHLLAFDSSIVVILLTAHGTIESAKEALRRGAFDYLQKPFDREALLATIKRALGMLDEIAELDISMQAKLLRALQERRIRRVGATFEIPVDVRVVAATNRDLRAMVSDGRFRDDLYYRINVLSIDVPPLRERREDIPVLIDYFLKKHTKNTSRLVRGLTTETKRILNDYGWPGNVRQLESAIERAILLCEGDMITPEDLPSELRQESQTVATRGFKLPPEGISFED